MKYLILISILMAHTGCGGNQKYVQNGSETLDGLVAQGIRECGSFADVAWVDQCFEFNCKTKKFRLWDSECNENDFAHKIMREKPSYFEAKP